LRGRFDVSAFLLPHSEMMPLFDMLDGPGKRQLL
jgi:hypothetical protein